MSGFKREVIRVSRSIDVSAVRRAAKEMALSLGFEARIGDEIAICASELASNVVKHAGGGMIEMVPVSTGDRVGMRLECSDWGPGIPHVDRSMSDGFSTVGSLGYGLGTVNRLMDSLVILSGASSSPSNKKIVSSDRNLVLKCSFERPQDLDSLRSAINRANHSGSSAATGCAQSFLSRHRMMYSDNSPNRMKIGK